MRSITARATVAAVLAVGILPLVSARSQAVSGGPDTVDEVHSSFGDDPGTSMWVGWRGAASAFAYGADASYGRTSPILTNSVIPVDIKGPFEHVILTGLSPGTVYHYQIDGGADHQFETAPTGDFTWDDIGDTGSTYDSFDAATGTGCDSSWMSSVWSQVASEHPDFVSHGGDITYANECGAGAVHQFFDDIEPVATLRAWQQSWGNHEYGSPTDDAPPGTPRDSMANYKGRIYLTNPQTVPNDTSAQISNPGCPSPENASANGCVGDDWGYYQVGHVLIIEYPEPWYNAQSRWQASADALMARAEADPSVWFIVTTGHRPAYTASANQLDSTLTNVLNQLGDKYSPSARPDGKYVLNIAHHVHGGEVFAPQHGVVHITNGGGGTEESAFGATVSGSVFHTGHFEHLHITVTGGQMKIDMICGPTWPAKPTLDPCTQGSVLYSTVISSPVAPRIPTDPDSTSASVAPSSSDPGTTSAARNSIGVGR